MDHYVVVPLTTPGVVTRLDWQLSQFKWHHGAKVQCSRTEKKITQRHVLGQ